jgi:PAS domain-containing protein
VRPVRLVLLQAFQQFLVCAALIGVSVAARGATWAPTYRRLAIGSLVTFVILAISDLGILEGLYWSGGVYDVIWILPFAFFAWAAAAAPGSHEEDPALAGFALTPSRPWVVFGALAALPIVDFGLRQVLPVEPSLEGFRDLSMVITIFSVLPLLMARLAVENSDARRADGRRLLLAAAMEQADDLISIMTPDGQIEYANAAFCRTLGCDSNEVIHLTADASSRSLGTRFDPMPGNDPTTQAGVARRADADWSTFHSCSTPGRLMDGTGRAWPLGAAEPRRTRRDSRPLFPGGWRRSVAPSRAWHELNNPLSADRGFSDLLMASERREEVRNYLEQVHAAARRAATIVRNLLAFVRRSSSERTRADLNDIVRSTLALRLYELSATGVELKEEYEDNLPSVLVCREEIQQVVLNIVLNAEQAMRRASARGRLSVRTMRAGTSDIAVEIQDDGPGVLPALAGRIFEPFFSTKDVGEGTGLGLSLSLGIAEAHGGTLELVHAPPGACFRLTLPAAAPSAAVTPEAPPAATPVLVAARGIRL